MDQDMHTGNLTASGGGAEPYASAPGLKDEHRRLMNLRRQGENSDELLNFVETFVRRGAATGVRLDDDRDRSAIQSLLDYWANILYRSGRPAIPSALEEFDPDLAPELDEAQCPYQGLDPFQADRSHLFFGRTHLADKLVTRLGQSRFLAVVGPSGSGKSSLVMAGLLPRLQSGALPGSERWCYLPPVIPGADPLKALARAALAGGPEGDDPEALARAREGLLADSSHLSALLASCARAPAVLVVDQFEEVFTLTDDESQRVSFVGNLLHLIEEPGSEHRVLITLRSDFESHVARLSDLKKTMDAAHERVTVMGAAEVREAIEAPARIVGLKFEEGVVDALVHDILGEPAALPLLQFSLWKLWKGRQRNLVTWVEYEMLGGGRMALARSADTFYGGLIPQDQRTARRILLRLVRPIEGFEVIGGRVRRASLFKDSDDPGRIERVLDRLVEERLVRLTRGATEAEDQVEVAHEALVRNWPLLVDWLEQDRQRLAERRRLETKALEWVRLGKGEVGLLDEEELFEAQRWLQSPVATELGYDDALPKLVAASHAAIDREQREAEELRRRELEQAREIADAQSKLAEVRRESAARLQRRLIRMWGALAVAIISAIVAVYFSVAASRQAETAIAEFGVSRAYNLALESTRSLGFDTRLSIEQALEALSFLEEPKNGTGMAGDSAFTETPDSRRAQAAFLEASSAARSADAFETARSALYQSLRQPTPAAGVSTGATVYSVAVQHDRGLVAMANGDGRVLMLRWANDRDLVLLSPLRHSQEPEAGQEPQEVWGVAFSDDGSRLASTGKDGRAVVWDIQDLTAVTAVNTIVGKHPKGVNGVALSPDGSRLATAGEDPVPRIWALDQFSPAEPILSLQGTPERPGHRDRVFDVNYSPDGRWLVTASVDGTAIVWDAETGEPTEDRWEHADRVYAAVVRPPSESLPWPLVGTASTDSGRGVARLWLLGLGFPFPFTVLEGHRDTVRGLAFSRDGGRVATASADGTVRIWETMSGDQLTVLAGYGSPVWGVGFDPDGHRVVIGGETRDEEGNGDQSSGMVWQLPIPQHDAPITSLDAGSDTPASASADGVVKVWEWNHYALKEKVEFRHQDADPGNLSHFSVAMSRDGRLVASGGSSGRINVWSTESESLSPPVSVLKGHEASIYGLAFSADGSSLVSAGRNGWVIRWYLSEDRSERLDNEDESPKREVYDVAFSRDGSRLMAAAYNRLFTWDLSTPSPKRKRYAMAKERSFDVAFSPNQQWIATADGDRVVRLWPAAAEENAAPTEMNRHRAPVSCLAFRPDGRRLASGSSDGEIRVWDLASHEEILVIPAYSAQITGLGFTPDGKRLLAASRDFLDVVPLEIEDLKAEAVNHLKPVPQISVFTDDGTGDPEAD